MGFHLFQVSVWYNPQHALSKACKLRVIEAKTCISGEASATQDVDKRRLDIGKKVLEAQIVHSEPSLYHGASFVW